MRTSIRTGILWALSVYVATVFVQSLFFKFTGAEESIFIFATLRTWSGISLFEPVGRFVIGGAELVASILILKPRTRIFGAALGIGIMIALDTLPDMFKTLLNVTADMLVAVMTVPAGELAVRAD